jgi:MFS family permease
MIAGSAFLAAATALPALFPGYAVLFVAALLIGFSFTMFHVALQHVTGEMGEAAGRAKRFSLLALAYSVSSMLGPLFAGFAIDHVGHRATYALLALVPLVPLTMLSMRRVPLPAPVARETGADPRGMFDLLRQPEMRGPLAINALFALGWDLHMVLVPIFGAQLGLSGSEIGIVFACFGLATFVVRGAMSWITGLASETTVLAGALFIAAVAYVTYPFATGSVTLAMLSFLLGFGLGAGQPMVMTLLSSRAPPGRMGEAAGLRLSLVHTMSVAVPLAFGVLGTTLGLLPVFWGVGACLVTGGIVARRA